MTVEEKIRELLEQHGMMSDGLEATMKEAKESDSPGKEMIKRWNDPIDAYPSQFIAVLWFSVRRIALKWVDENMPLAWYRPLLTGEDLL